MWPYFDFEPKGSLPFRQWYRCRAGYYVATDSLGQVWTIRRENCPPSQGPWRAYGPHCLQHHIACAKSGHRLAYQVVEDYIVPVDSVTAKPAAPCKECARNVQP